MYFINLIKTLQSYHLFSHLQWNSSSYKFQVDDSVGTSLSQLEIGNETGNEHEKMPINPATEILGQLNTRCEYIPEQFSPPYSQLDEDNAVLAHPIAHRLKRRRGTVTTSSSTGLPASKTVCSTSRKPVFLKKAP